MPLKIQNLNITNRERDVLEVLWTSNKPLLASDIPKINPSLSISSVQLALLLYFSFFVVIEPYAIHSYDAANTIELTEDSSYLIHNPEGGYDVFVNHNYFATVQEIKDSYSHLTIYKNLKEAKNHEIHN